MGDSSGEPYQLISTTPVLRKPAAVIGAAEAPDRIDGGPVRSRDCPCVIDQIPIARPVSPACTQGAPPDACQHRLALVQESPGTIQRNARLFWRDPSTFRGDNHAQAPNRCCGAPSIGGDAQLPSAGTVLLPIEPQSSRTLLGRAGYRRRDSGGAGGALVVELQCGTASLLHAQRLGRLTPLLEILTETSDAALVQGKGDIISKQVADSARLLILPNPKAPCDPTQPISSAPLRLRAGAALLAVCEAALRSTLK